MTPESDLEPVDLCLQLAEDMKVRDLRRLDLEGNTLFDTFVVGTCTSSRHLRSAADHIYVECKRLGHQARTTEKSDAWTVLDLGRILVHLFTEEARERYNLEGLWLEGDVDGNMIERTLEWETNRRLDR